MKEYEKANRRADFRSVIDEVISDSSNSAGERLADGMVMSYLDNIMSGNAQ
jgi:hypothetical protein